MGIIVACIVELTLQRIRIDPFDLIVTQYKPSEISNLKFYSTNLSCDLLQNCMW